MRPPPSLRACRWSCRCGTATTSTSTPSAGTWSTTQRRCTPYALRDPVNFLVQTLFYMGPKRGATYGLLARRMLWPSLATPSLSGTLSLPPSGGRGRGATLEAMGTWTTSLASDLLQNLYHAQEACVLVRSMGLFAWLLCAGGSAPITADSDSFGANAVGSAYAHLICDLNRGELLLFGHSALGIPAVFL